MGKAAQKRATIPEIVLRRQQELKTAVARLGDGDEGAEFSRKLVAELATAKGIRSKVKRQACETCIRKRLDEIDQIQGDFDPRVNRELTLIIFLGMRRIDNKLRLDACALLQLHGSREAIGTVCVAFPGLIEALNR